MRTGLWCCASGLLVAACTPAPPPAWSGHVEGTTSMSPRRSAAACSSSPCIAGSRCKQGRQLFTLESESERAARDEAAALMAAAQAQAEDAAKGDAPPNWP